MAIIIDLRMAIPRDWEFGSGDWNYIQIYGETKV